MLNKIEIDNWKKRALQGYDKAKSYISDICSHGSFIDNIMDKVYNPTPKSKLFPYSYYDKDKGLFYSGKNTVGFILECDPAVGCDSSFYKQISLIFDDQIPFGGVLQTLLLASDDLDSQIQKWISARVKSGDIYKKLTEYKTDFYLNYNNKENQGFKQRNFRLFFSFSIILDKNSSFEQIIEFRDRLKTQLSTMGLMPREIGAEVLINLVQELINYPAVSSQYNANDLISNQIGDISNALLVDSKGLLHKGGEYITRCYEIDSYPEEFSVSELPKILGDSEQDNLQIPCRFALSYTVINNIRDPAQESLAFKGEKVLDQVNSFLAKHNRILRDEAKEWEKILSQNLKKNRERFITSGFSLMVTTKAELINKTEQTLISLWKKNDIQIKSSVFFHLPVLLSMCPFMPSLGLGQILKSFGVTRTVLSSEPKAFLPVHAEWKGSNTGGMLLSGMRGQLFSWDSFERGSNNNIVVVGESGSGKSVFQQEFVMSQLAKGARVFVIDIGRSFEKTCKIVGGDFISFGSGSKISLNPFSNIPEDGKYKEGAQIDEEVPDLTQDSLSMLLYVVEKMAAPKAGTEDIQDSILSKAIGRVWRKYKTKANIDRLIECLEEEGQRGKDLGLMLYEFSSEGSYGRFFNGKDNIEFNNDLTVLEFEELRERPNLGAVIMQMLAIQIVQQVYLSDRKQRFVILFDEAWYALDNFPFMLASMAKTIRKYNGALGLGTQSLTDFYGTGEGSSPADKARHGVIENCSWRILLKQKNDSAERASKLGFTSSQIQMLKNLNPPNGEYSECLISQSDKEYFICRLLLEPFSQVLYSSKPEVYSEVKSLMANGMKTGEAVETVMRKMYDV